VSLKESSTQPRIHTIIFAIITGPLLILTPYQSHTNVLVITISIIARLRSPTLCDFHECHTCGTNVTQVRNDPTYPIRLVRLDGLEVLFMPAFFSLVNKEESVQVNPE
jgi:hypothetical protein